MTYGRNAASNAGVRVACALSAIALVACQAAAPRTALAEAGAALVIEGATLVDGRSGSRRDVTLVAEGGRISYIGVEPGAPPAGAQVIDGAGRFVIPGLIDVHVHDSAEGYLRQMLSWGVTSAQLMPRALTEGPTELERRSQDAGAPIPRLQVTPMFAAAFPDNLVPDTYEFLKPATPAEARRTVRDLHARGYRQIKIIQDDSTGWAGEVNRTEPIPQPVYEALVREARARGMRVYVHSTQREMTRAVISAGADALLHGTMDAELTQEDWREMRDASIAWTPTLHALLLFGDQRRYARRLLAERELASALAGEELAQRQALAAAEESVVPPKMETLVEHTERYVTTIARNTRHALDAGVPVAVGTDGGPAGLSTQLELALLVENGMTPAEVLAAATYGGAVAMGWDDVVGSVEVGKLADLVVLDADPRADVRHCRRIAWVIKGRRAYRPEQLRAR